MAGPFSLKDNALLSRRGGHSTGAETPAAGTPDTGSHGVGAHTAAPTGVDALLASSAAAPTAAVSAVGTAASRDGVGGRLRKLGTTVDGSRRRRGRTDVRKLANTLGMLAIGLGIGAVIIGWYGASHSPYLYQEVPYLISGGLLGVSLVIAGGVLVNTASSMRRTQEAHRDTQAVLRALDRLERTTRASALGSFDPPAHAGNGGSSSTDSRVADGRVADGRVADGRVAADLPQGVSR